jgi:hypothetical protein
MPASAANNSANPDLTTCMQNVQAQHSKQAQDQTAAHARIFGNATVPNLNTTCMTTLMNLALNIGNLTNPFALIWNAIVNMIIVPLINSVCQMIMSAIQAAVSLVKSLLCLPLPHFGLSIQLPHFGGGNCSGLSLLPALGTTTGQRPANANYWKTWGMNPQ